MTGLQEKLLELLCEIDDICKKHGIEYMLFAGTALGAERHHGFIPWDDDADIIMTLENYEKFIKVAKNELRPDRVLNALENNTPGYFLTYARYVDTNTTAIQRHTAFGGCDPGVKIDIFCAIPTYDQIEKAELHKQQILAFAETICRYGVMYTFRDDAFYPLFQSEQEKMEKLGREKYIDESLKALRKKTKWFGRPKHYVLFAGIMSNSYVLDAKLLEKTKYVPFEDTMLPISVNNIDFNKELYGEGWINIPANIEKPRHTMLLDLHEPFTKYIDVLQSSPTYHDNEKVVSQRRMVHLKERAIFRDVSINRQKLLNLVVEQSTMNRFTTMPAESLQDWKLMDELFQPYYSMQLHRNNRFYRLMIPLEEKVFVHAMSTAVVMGKHDIAMDILKLARKTAYITEKQFLTFNNQIQLCIKVTEEMYLLRDIQRLEDTLERIDDAIVNQSITVKAAKLWVAIQKCEDASGYEAVCQQLDDTMREFSNIGELIAMKGYCLERLGKHEDAKQTYQTAIKCVRNAIVFQQLLDGGFDPYEE